MSTTEPNYGSKDCYTKQVKWIVRVQALLQEIIDLANTEESIADVIYNKEKLSHILRLFPLFMVDKLAKVQGYKEVKYKKIIEKLEEWKVTSQNRELIYGSGSSSSSPQGQQRVSVKPDPPPLLPLPLGHINFQQPKNLPTCRICKVLQSQGDTAGLFDKHVSDYATGCPKFAKMGTDQRLVVAKEARFCSNCMGKDTKFSRDHWRECPVKKGKGMYSCKADSCNLHMWLCSKHNADNKEQMVKFAEQLQERAGVRLVFVLKKKVTNPPKSLDQDRASHQATQSPEIVTPPASPTSPVPPTSPLSFCTMGEKGIKQAVRKMVRLNKKKEVKASDKNDAFQ